MSSTNYRLLIAGRRAGKATKRAAAIADATEAQQDALYSILKATDPHSDTADTLYDTWASALVEAGVRVPIA